MCIIHHYVPHALTDVFVYVFYVVWHCAGWCVTPGRLLTEKKATFASSEAPAIAAWIIITRMVWAVQSTLLMSLCVVCAVYYMMCRIPLVPALRNDLRGE